MTGRIGTALLIVNPAARRARAALEDVLAAFRDAGVACAVRETTGPGDATRLVREALGGPHAHDAIFALGGDGTAMEVATALAGVPGAPPFGILALGTANVLARSLGIPLAPAAAVRSLVEADIVAIDLGQVTGGASFAIGLGIGLDASMIGGASSIMKRRVGWLAYAWAALRAGLMLERFTARITVDGSTHEVETSSVLVANFGRVLGDLLCFGEGVGHRDGVLDVCIYSPRTIADAARILWRMLSGGVGEDRCVRIISGRHVTISTDPPRPMQSDGELLGTTPVEIRVLPAAVRLLSPRTTPRRWRRLRRSGPHNSIA